MLSDLATISLGSRVKNPETLILKVGIESSIKSNFYMAQCLLSHVIDIPNHVEVLTVAVVTFLVGVLNYCFVSPSITPIQSSTYVIQHVVLDLWSRIDLDQPPSNI